jgi:hypothetical protein
MKAYQPVFRECILRFGDQFPRLSKEIQESVMPN